MTIELITGSPGSGKTTYAVAARLLAESKRVIETEAGSVTRRLVVAGIRGLAVDHERLPHKLTGETVPASEVERFNAMRQDVEDQPVYQRLPGDPPLDVPAIVQNWWLWCRPGDFIVVDEAQFMAPRGTMGKKPPYWVQALEIHRHYGVDFLFITQHPGLIDTTIRHLVGMHRHIRSVMGWPLCMVYEWDHASPPEKHSTSSKSKFYRKSEYYKLFHSSVAHVKPPTAGRGSLGLILGLAVAFGVGMWNFSGKWRDQAGHAQAVAAASAPVVSHVVHSPPAGPDAPTGWADVPALAGCMAVGHACTCYARTDGRRVAVAHAMCELSSRSYEGLVRWMPRPDPPRAERPSASLGSIFAEAVDAQ